MISHDFIKKYSEGFSIGETLDSPNRILSSEREKVNEKVRIIEKHRDYCVVFNGKYAYCILWIDLLRKELGQTEEEGV